MKIGTAVARNVLREMPCFNGFNQTTPVPNQKIDFVYFDLGKVILDFDHQIACQSIANQTSLSPEQVFAAMFETGLEVRYETGLIDSSEFHKEFCESTKSKIGQPELLRSMSDIFSPNRPIFSLIAQLRAVNFPIGILSNTCPAHWEFVYQQYKILRDCFSPIILSYEVNSMKPDSKIYERAIEQAGCHIENCFFVDDRQENVDGANRAGMDAVLYTSVPKLVRELVNRGVEINY